MFFSPGLLTVACLAATFGADEETVLEFQPAVVVRSPWMPADPWRPLGSELHLGGHRFVVDWGADGECLQVDTNADGRTDLLLTGTWKSFELAVPDDERPFRYGLAVERRGRDWFWSPLEWMTARSEGATVSLFDLNGDGDFTDVGADAVRIGGSSAALLSRVISVRGELFALDVQEGARRATLRPFDGPRARLDVTSAYFSEGELIHAVFSCDAGYSFDFAATCGGLEVPAGDYRFVAGRVEGSLETAHLAPGRMGPVTLGPGERHVIEWGGPVSAEFGIRRCSRRVTILPDVRFFGQAGEEVLAFEPTAGAPRVEVRDLESGDLLEYGVLGGCCGGGLSACKLDVPGDAEIEVLLIHERQLFGRIVGRAR